LHEGNSEGRSIKETLQNTEFRRYEDLPPLLITFKLLVMVDKLKSHFLFIVLCSVMDGMYAGFAGATNGHRCMTFCRN
jgi:hypothetical protein